MYFVHILVGHIFFGKKESDSAEQGDDAPTKNPLDSTDLTLPVLSLMLSSPAC
jgi:hypothetical protein